MTRRLRHTIIVALLTAGQLLLAGATFAQNPTQVIAVATRNEDTQISDIFTIQLNGDNRTNLTQHPADDIWPAWSPDAKQIAFASDRAGSYDIWLMQADGSNPTKLTDSEMHDVLPVWSPDGSHILFVRAKGELRSSDTKFDLHVIRLENSATSQSIHDDLTLSGLVASWSPDGSRIMFSAIPTSEKSDLDSEIYIVNAYGGRSILQVTDNKVFETAPRWISDFEIMYFHTEVLYERDESRGYYKLNPVTGAREFLIDPFDIYSAVGFESGTLVMLFDGLDGICYFNTETGAQVFIDNTGPFDDSMSWKPTNPELTAESEAHHRFRRGKC